MRFCISFIIIIVYCTIVTIVFIVFMTRERKSEFVIALAVVLLFRCSLDKKQRVNV